MAVDEIIGPKSVAPPDAFVNLRSRKFLFRFAFNAINLKSEYAGLTWILFFGYTYDDVWLQLLRYSFMRIVFSSHILSYLSSIWQLRQYNLIVLTDVKPTNQSINQH